MFHDNAVLFRLLELLTECGASADDRQQLLRAIQALEDFFLITIVGEFNAGKSSVINALLGGKFCQTGVTPTTATINSTCAHYLLC
jgi:ribosome biogenesis GTPase A